VTAQTAFAIGSISKAFLGALASKLEMNGTLRLDEAVPSGLLPRSAPRGLTLRHLLTHTSGMSFRKLTPEQHDRAFVDRRGEPFPAEDRPGVERVAAAGQRFRYENHAYEIAALAIESVTSQTRAELLRRHFLNPLRLSRTYSQPDERPEPPIAHGYFWPTDAADVDVTDLGGGFVPNLAFVSYLPASGGLASTPTDLGKWASAAWGDDARRRALTATNEKSSRPPAEWSADKYGVGVVVRRTPTGSMYSHGGGGPGFQSFLAYLPDCDVSIALAVNSNHFSAEVAEAVKDLLEAVRFAVPVPVTT
jgi:D-alanyl-D-alanine carboxypeptidase